MTTTTFDTYATRTISKVHEYGRRAKRAWFALTTPEDPDFIVVDVPADELRKRLEKDPNAEHIYVATREPKRKPPFVVAGASFILGTILG